LSQSKCVAFKSVSLEVSFSELPSQGSRFWETGNERRRDDRLISNYESGDKEETPAGLLQKITD